ncbi:MAG TPA: IclR family transcriptional regulator [Solirubrobacteraceae bacterium]|nr:IclR family transcriptional regulator [Solirubrobacteraceae bacterium]
MTALVTAGSTRTVERALGLLAEVCAEGSISLTDCARRAQLPASTALRLLRTLEATGFVTRAEDGTFRAGSRLIQFGALALSRQSLVTLAQPSLARIVDQTGESSYLVARGPRDTAVYLAMVEGSHPVRHTSWVGRAIDLADLAVGHALAGEVGADGYVAQRDRLEPDITAIAAPIRWSGGVAGALNLLGPTYRIDESTLRRYGEIVAHEAAAIAERFGVSPVRVTQGGPP